MKQDEKVMVAAAAQAVAVESSTEMFSTVEQPTPLDLIALNKPGYEVWASQTMSGTKRRPRLLLVMYEELQEPVLTIIDPQTNEQVFSADDYLEIIDYLSESEYELVEGQVIFDLEDAVADE